MSQDYAFIVQGKSVRVDVTDAAGTPFKVQPGGNLSSPQLMVTNPSLSVPAFLAFGSSAEDDTGKTMTVAIPTVGTPANGVYILPNSTQIFSYDPNSYLAAICLTGGSTSLYLTVGEGF